MKRTSEDNVERIFKTIKKKAPVITINRRTLSPPGLSVGFVFDRLPDGRLVLVTVGHALYPEDDPGAFYFRIADGRALDIEQYLHPVNPAYDVAFLIAKPLSKFSPIIFGRPKNEQVFPGQIYNAKNNLVYGSPPLVLFVQSNAEVYKDQVIMAPPWREQITTGSSRIRFVPLSDTAVLAECETMGWVRMSHARFVSRPGNSGSPIWDDNWNLYGMDVRGRGGQPGQSDDLAYYSASALDRFWSEVKAKHGI